MFTFVNLGHLWLNKKIEKSSISLSLYVQMQPLRFHMYNTSVSTHNEGNIAVNRNAFSTNFWKFLIQYVFSTFRFQSKALLKNFHRNANLPVSISVCLAFKISLLEENSTEQNTDDEKNLIFLTTHIYIHLIINFVSLISFLSLPASVELIQTK